MLVLVIVGILYSAFILGAVLVLIGGEQGDVFYELGGRLIGFSMKWMLYAGLPALFFSIMSER